MPVEGVRLNRWESCSVVVQYCGGTPPESTKSSDIKLEVIERHSVNASDVIGISNPKVSRVCNGKLRNGTRETAHPLCQETYRDLNEGQIMEEMTPDM